MTCALYVKMVFWTHSIYEKHNRWYSFCENILDERRFLNMKNGKKFFLNSFAFLMSFLSISSVNSACAIIFGQEKEPDSLARYKKC